MAEHWTRIEPITDKLGELYEAEQYQELAEMAGMVKGQEQTKQAEQAKPERKPLLDEKTLKRFREVSRQEGEKNPLVIAKFFNFAGAGTWYATEYDEHDKIFFGYVSLFGDHNDEWGSFSLAELESVPTIERDKHCGEKTISEHNVKTLVTA